MESIFKGFLGIFFLMVLSFTGIELIGASSDARRADSFLAKSVEMIEAGHYRKSVVDACIADAEALGYELQVDIVENEWGDCFGQAKLSYQYRISIIGLAEEHEVTADIR